MAGVDFEAMVGRVLRAATTGPVSDEVGDPFPMVRLFLLTTIPMDDARWLRGGQLQVEVWGTPDGSKAACYSLMESVLDACYDLVGTEQAEGVVSRVVLDSGPSWLPDPTDRHPRYVSTVTVYAHPGIDPA